ncbi:MAG: hypothetical protein DRI57_03365 [Deltaproteobacteria bacterium]|nr:MAG: hypothetical protein DRI57_03365 [Deltaproteobacteria bacterium]
MLSDYKGLCSAVRFRLTKSEPNLPDLSIRQEFFRSYAEAYPNIFKQLHSVEMKIQIKLMNFYIIK